MPLLTHNNVTVNPLDEQTKAIKKFTVKRKKTDEDHVMIQRLEWEAGRYHDRQIAPDVPGVNVVTCLRDAAKLDEAGRRGDAQRGRDRGPATALIPQARAIFAGCGNRTSRISGRLGISRIR